MSHNNLLVQALFAEMTCCTAAIATQVNINTDNDIMDKMKIWGGQMSDRRWVVPPVLAAAIHAMVSGPCLSQWAALWPGTRWQT